MYFTCDSVWWLICDYDFKYSPRIPYGIWMIKNWLILGTWWFLYIMLLIPTILGFDLEVKSSSKMLWFQNSFKKHLIRIMKNETNRAQKIFFLHNDLALKRFKFVFVRDRSTSRLWCTRTDTNSSRLSNECFLFYCLVHNLLKYVMMM